MGTLTEQATKLEFDGKLMCVLYIAGIGFDVESYLNKTNYNEESILFCGKHKLDDALVEKISANKYFKSQAFEMLNQTILTLKISEQPDVVQQIQDAFEFLETYKNDLRLLKTYSNIQNVTMKFNSEQNENLDRCREFLNPEFYKLISECGIQILMMG